MSARRRSPGKNDKQMKLLGFQQEAVDRLSDYLTQFRTWTQYDPRFARLAAQNAWEEVNHVSDVRPYCKLVSSAGKSIPCLSFVIPTGGGKTITAMGCAIEATRNLTHTTNFVVWVVPSDTIYQQTLAYLNDGYLNQFVLDSGFSELQVKRIGDPWTVLDLDASVFKVLLVSRQSITGNRADLHFRRPADSLRHLPIWNSVSEQPSLQNFLNLNKPVFVLDEAHGFYTDTGRSFFKEHDLTSCVLEFTATPKDYSGQDYPNVLVDVDARTLINEQLIKHPLVCHSEPGLGPAELIAQVVQERDLLEQRLLKEGFNTTPKVLISCRRTAERHAEDTLSVQTIRGHLKDIGIDDSRIAIKSSERNELANEEVDSPNCQLQYILTQRALVEGWDAKSVFKIVLVNDIGASLTNFQIVGRGLRQPDRQYFVDKKLNALHVYTNGNKQDDALNKLRDFLVGEGLAGGLAITTNTNPLSPSFNFSRKRFQAPALDFDANSSNVDAKAIDLMAKKPPKPLSVSQAQTAAGPTESSMAVIDLTVSTSSNPTNHVHHRPGHLSASVWGNEFRISLLRFNSNYFRSTSDSLEWIERQIRSFRRETAFKRLLGINPTKVARGLSQYIQKTYLDCRQKVIIDLIAKSSIIDKEFAGDLVAPEIVDSDPSGTAPFDNCIVGDVPKKLFNESELEFARILDKTGHSWVRNRQSDGWYYFPGGTTGKFYPDFLLLLDQRKNSSYRKIYVFETKGAHLAGSLDSQMKREICNEISQKKRICAYLEEFSDAKTTVESLATTARQTTSNQINKKTGTRKITKKRGE